MEIPEYISQPSLYLVWVSGNKFKHLIETFKTLDEAIRCADKYSNAKELKTINITDALATSVETVGILKWPDQYFGQTTIHIVYTKEINN